MVSLRKRPYSGTNIAAAAAATRPAKSAETSPAPIQPAPAPVQPAGPLQRLRSNWHFANVCQWIYLFGPAVKIPDDIDIDVRTSVHGTPALSPAANLELLQNFETECLKPRSTVLVDIGLCLLKYLSSHRGLNHELFDEYTRRQYLQKSPEKNPFGLDDVAHPFQDFAIETRLRILHQMTQWIMINADKLRDRMADLNDTDHTGWRIEPYGWDSLDRTYFVLDDNRIYRLTDAPEPTPQPSKSKKSRRTQRSGGRSSKRRRVSQAAGVDSADAEEEEPASEPLADEPEPHADDGLGGAKWECVAVGYSEVAAFLATLQKTKDENEKILRDQIKEHLLPILEKQETSRKRKHQQREKELENLAKLANAKRSSRLAVKQEQKNQEENAREEERRQQEHHVKARKEEQARLKREKERDQRLRARIRRVKDREARKLVHQQELTRLSSQSTEIPEGQRLSGRRLQAEIERQKQALAALDDEDDWIFDCVCGVHGQVDDGTHSLACELCNVWLHSKCVGVDQHDAEQPDFNFVCASCKRREEDEANRPRTVIKLKVGQAAVEPAAAAADGSAAPGADNFQEPLSQEPPPAETASKPKDTDQHQESRPFVTETHDHPRPQPAPSSPPPAPSSPRGVPPSPSKKSASALLGASKNGCTPSVENGFASTIFASRKPNDRAGDSNAAANGRPETPTSKVSGNGQSFDAPGAGTPQRFMTTNTTTTTPMSRGLPTPSGNGVLPPPGRKSMSFEESLNRTLNSSPLGASADRDNPSSPFSNAEPGISPLKNTPSVPSAQNGSLKTNASILPPAVLAPLHRELILTPPVKMTEEQRRHSQLQQRLLSPLAGRGLDNDAEHGETNGAVTSENET
ncbi:uncharacterized protein BROUX77_003349 [Berkeleyomyces rouxiae]|uniref:uncharacterized protein n=1 Tax=Berkeleyomyces rouxiae TaxID=2035830 RepID=UPI003B810BCC